MNFTEIVKEHNRFCSKISHYHPKISSQDDMKKTIITTLLYAFIFTFLIGVGNCDVVGISGTGGMVESTV